MLIQVRYALLSCLALAPLADARELPDMWNPPVEMQLEVIPYTVTPSKGFSMGSVNGKTAYDNELRLQMFDWEPTIEVRWREQALNLPPPTVVPYVERTALWEMNGVRIRSNTAMHREDRIFLQIAEDEKKARCFILNQGCPDQTN